MKIKFKLNGTAIAIDVSGSERLIDILRERLDLVGTKEGCGKGECGACTVLFDNLPTCSCLMIAAQLNGHEVVTIEGLASDKRYSKILKAYEETGAVQCGFCSPGMIVSTAALLRKNKKPSKEQIKHALAGNLCRCTGYSKIIEAVTLASKKMAADK
jgi:aerobic carbon-monoxide dehydrogenase small subunit